MTTTEEMLADFKCEEAIMYKFMEKTDQDLLDAIDDWFYNLN